MNNGLAAGAARSIWAAAEPFTLWGLFRPGVATALQRSGVDPRMAYFATRGAPMGEAHPAVVVAAFRSLPAGPILAAMPGIWQAVRPGDVIDTTHQAIAQDCRDIFVDVDLPASVDDVAAVLGDIVADLDTTGRGLAAAGQAVAAPEDPWAAVWRHLTTLREYRGDAHVAALVTADLDRAETEVLMVAWAAGHVDAATLRQTRGIGDDDWAQATNRLRERGLFDGHGSITIEGTALRDRIEHLTDVASSPPWRTRTPDVADLVRSFATVLSTVLIERGQMTAVTPVGAPWPPPR